MARSFNGTSDFITTPNSAALQPTTAITIACWFRSVVDSQFRHLVVKQAASTWVQPFAVWAYRIRNTNVMEAWINDGNVAGNYVTSSTAIAANKWTQGAFTFDGTTKKLYLNGRLDKSTAQTASLNTSTFQMWIGMHEGAGASEFWKGDIAHVGIWSVALTPSEIAALWNGWRPIDIRPQKLVGYWPLGPSSEQSAGAAIDLSPYRGLGTPTGTLFSAEPPAMRWTPPRRQRFELFNVQPPAASSVIFRKTLSPIGGRVGSRQIQGWAQ